MKGVETWAAYSAAYRERYGVDPARNAKVNSILAKLVDRVGSTEAPQIAAFFVSHNAQQYVRAGHSVELLLRDAEKLAMECRTGRTITNREAVEADKRQAKAEAWRELGEDELVRAIAVTAEVLGTDFSKDAARAMHRVLAPFGHAAVIAALKRCMYECRGRLTPAEIVSRIDDGRPGAEEAWGMVASLTEDASLCWTDEMAAAWGVARHALEAGDKIGARMAFKEKYQQEVLKARTEAKPAKWRMSLGQSSAERTPAIQSAVAAGRIGEAQAAQLLPAPTTGMPENIKAKLAEVRAAIGGRSEGHNNASANAVRDMREDDGARGEGDDDLAVGKQLAPRSPRLRAKVQKRGNQEG